MQFGASVWTHGSDVQRTIAQYYATAQQAEELGFDTLWTGDHLVPPKRLASKYPYSPTGAFGAAAGVRLDALTSLAALASRTKRIKLCTGVLVLPLRHPVLTAKMLVTIDSFAGGNRLIVGVGAGWMREEFEALGSAPFEHRGSVSDEYIQIFRELWTKEAPEFHGKFYQFSNVHFEPKPLGVIPIWVGGNSEPALRRAARLGNGWHALSLTAAQFTAAREQLCAYCREYHTDFDRLTLSLMLTLTVDPAAGVSGEAQTVGQGLLRGSPQQLAAAIRIFEAAGVQHLQVNALAADSPGLEGRARGLELFGRQVLPLLR